MISGSTEEGDQGIISIFIKTIKKDEKGKISMVDYNKEIEKLLFDLWDVNID